MHPGAGPVYPGIPVPGPPHPGCAQDQIHVGVAGIDPPPYFGVPPLPTPEIAEVPPATRPLFFVRGLGYQIIQPDSVHNPGSTRRALHRRALPHSYRRSLWGEPNVVQRFDRTQKPVSQEKQNIVFELPLHGRALTA